jgi:hypothetical protein
MSGKAAISGHFSFTWMFNQKPLSSWPITILTDCSSQLNLPRKRK